MVTKPQFPPLSAPLPDDYACSDPEPRDVIQGPTINKAGYFVARHFATQQDTLVRAPCVVAYDPQNLNRRVEPDLLVAHGVDTAPILARNGYIIWEVGKPPDFVMEVASETTHGRDTGFKRDLYASLGIAEYWRIDPTGGDFYGYPMAGDALVDGEYRPIPLEHETDGMLWGYSPTLDLCPCWKPHWDWDVDDETHLRLFDRKTGRYLCDISLVEYALASERAAREGEQQVLAQAQARVRQLEEQLRRQQP